MWTSSSGLGSVSDNQSTNCGKEIASAASAGRPKSWTMRSLNSGRCWPATIFSTTARSAGRKTDVLLPGALSQPERMPQRPCPPGGLPHRRCEPGPHDCRRIVY
eukprot:scaffold42659_cov62-Phaeocystis_antarctica.AAC.11